MPSHDHLFLYGPSCAGKSVGGKLLAESLELPFYDIDDEIQRYAATTVEEIFAQSGEAAFRQIEKTVLEKTVQESNEAVIALGGGALLNKESRDFAQKNGSILCLRAGAQTLINRLKSTDTIRPLLEDKQGSAVSDYLNSRASHYDSFSLQLETDQLSPSETAWEAQKKFGCYKLKQMGSPYDVRILPGSLGDISTQLQRRSLKGPFCIVADTNTRMYADAVQHSLEKSGLKAAITIIPAGETHKTVHTVQNLWDSFLENDLERESTVLAVGGGVVGDLAGFAAATYLRGIDWVSIPTTLLSMVDASIGGKTGADLPSGKNLVGAFHAPKLVLVDPNVLSTLPEREMRAGMAEVVKAAVIADPELFQRCRTIDTNSSIASILSQAMSIKIRVIESDPFEKGERALLNFGHTIGHAVEHASGFDLLHGEAIAIGMHLETLLGEKLGLTRTGTASQIASCLQHLGLPVSIPPGLNMSEILRAINLDKKKTGGAIRFALPQQIGEADLFRISKEIYSNFLKN